MSYFTVILWREAWSGARNWQATTNRKNLGKAKRKQQSVCPTHLPESSLLESILAEQCVCLQEGPWARMTGQRQPGNNPLTMSLETESLVAELGFLTLLLSMRCPYPRKPLVLSACASPQITHFPVLQKSPLGGPGGRPPSCNKAITGFPHNASPSLHPK